MFPFDPPVVSVPWLVPKSASSAIRLRIEDSIRVAIGAISYVYMAVFVAAVTSSPATEVMESPPHNGFMKPGAVVRTE